MRSCSVSDFKVKYKVRRQPVCPRLPPLDSTAKFYLLCSRELQFMFSLLPIQFAWNSHDKIHRLAGKAPSSQSHLAIHHSHDWKFDEEGGSAGNLSVARPGCFYRNFLPIFSSSRLTSRLVILGPTPEHYTSHTTHQSSVQQTCEICQPSCYLATSGIKLYRADVMLFSEGITGQTTHFLRPKTLIDK